MGLPRQSRPITLTTTSAKSGIAGSQSAGTFKGFRCLLYTSLGGNALGNTLPEQMIAVKSTAKALCDLIEEGHQVVVVHGNGPDVYKRQMVS